MTEAEVSVPGKPYLPEVRLGSLNGRPIITIDEEAAYLDVGRRGQEWAFSLRDQRTPPIVKTSWVNLDGPELLRTSPHTVAIRDELARLYPETWRLILDAIIGIIQENIGRWPITEAREELVKLSHITGNAESLKSQETSRSQGDSFKHNSELRGTLKG